MLLNGPPFVPDTFSSPDRTDNAGYGFTLWRGVRSRHSIFPAVN
jgi:hypothetical protein